MSSALRVEIRTACPQLPGAITDLRRGKLGAIETAVDKALATGTPYEIDLELVQPDGSKRWSIAHGEPRRDASGNITRLRGTVQDITERKRAELQTAEAVMRGRAKPCLRGHHQCPRRHRICQPQIHSAYRLYVGRGDRPEPPHTEIGDALCHDLSGTLENYSLGGRVARGACQ